jgi:type III secretion protein S
MDPHVLIELTQRLLMLVLLVSLPVVAVAVLVGLVVGLLQAVTQIQDPSLPFGAKLIACVAVMAALGPWAGSELLQFGHSAFESITRQGR